MNTSHWKRVSSLALAALAVAASTNGWAHSVSAAGTAGAPKAPQIATHTGAFDCRVPAKQRNFVCGAELVQPPAAPPDPQGQVCPDWVHDKYVVVAVQEASGEWVTKPAPAGLDARSVAWRTWHPNIDAATGCHSTHEHGEEPLAAFAPYGTGPAFGLIGCLHGGTHCAEPHHAFKLQNVVPGEVAEDGAQSLVSAQQLIHFGTTNPGRFTTQHHSVEFWLIKPASIDRVHVMAMADFGAFPRCRGDLADRDRKLNSGACANFTAFERDDGQPRDFGYEAWASQFVIRHPDMKTSGGGKSRDDDVAWRIGMGSNAFNPASAFRAQGNTFVPVPRPGKFGCVREVYFTGPFYYIRDTGIDRAWTDPYGRIAEPNAPGAVLQIVGTPNEALTGGPGSGLVAVSTAAEASTVFKGLANSCSEFLSTPN